MQNDEEDEEAIDMPKFGLEAFADILREYDGWKAEQALELTLYAAQREFLQTLFEHLPAMISAPDWRLRAAGLEAIGAISASTKDVGPAVGDGVPADHFYRQSRTSCSRSSIW